MLRLSEHDLRAIRVFLAVADCRGLAAAQAELGMVTSTISHHISALEQRLGSRLCQRGRAGFMLTPEGRTVYDAAQKLTQGLEVFQTDLGALKGDLAGELRMAAIDTAISDPNSPLLSAIAKFNTRRNSTTIAMHVDDVPSIERNILAGHLDLAVTCTPRKIEGIKYKHLFDQCLMLYCSERHAIFSLSDDMINVHMLKDQRVVSRDIWAVIESEQFLAKRADAIVNHIDAKTHLILTGAYIGFMPVFHAQPWVNRGELRAIRPADFRWTTSYYLMRKSGAVPSNQLRLFLQDLEGSIGSAQPYAITMA